MTDAQEQTSAPMENSAQAIVNDQNLAREETPVSATQQSSQSAEPVAQEKMIPQSQVNEIIKSRLAKERESAAKSEFNQQQDMAQIDQESLRHEKGLSKQMAELASEKAWKHCFDRLTEEQRTHLMDWALAVKKIGKGTGKFISVV